MPSPSSRVAGVMTTSHSSRTPRATASTGSKLRDRSSQATTEPSACASAATRRASVVRPLEPSPRIATLAEVGQAARSEDRVERGEPGVDDPLAGERHRRRLGCQRKRTEDPRSCRTPASLEARERGVHISSGGRHRTAILEHLFYSINPRSGVGICTIHGRERPPMSYAPRLHIWSGGRSDPGPGPPTDPDVRTVCIRYAYEISGRFGSEIVHIAEPRPGGADASQAGADRQAHDPSQPGHAKCLASAPTMLPMPATTPEPRPERPILVVDDDAKIVRLVRTYLEREGYAVVAAADGPAALDAIETHRPALVVLDLMLPELDGRAVIRAVRRDDEAAATPIIVLSARGSTIDRIAGLEDGADDYLPKPFSPAELVLRVKSILRRAAPADAYDLDTPAAASTATWRSTATASRSPATASRSR